MTKLRIQQIPLFTAIVEEITRQAEEQGITLVAIPRQLNAVVDAANSIVKEFQRDLIPSKEGMGLHAWLRSDDTGLSSRAMATRMYPTLCAGVGVEVTSNHPHDPGDFGRCYRFLRAVKGARDLVPQMADVSPAWTKLAGNWTRLEALYEEELTAETGSAPKLYAEIQALIKP